MLIKKEDVSTKVNGPGCIVDEYLFGNKDLGIAKATITGRWPVQGKSMNTKTDIIYYVLSGTATLTTVKGIFDIKEGDAYFIAKNEWYYVEGNNLVALLSCAPDWTFEQYRHLD